MIASSGKKGGKRVLVFNDVVVNVSLRGSKLYAILRRIAEENDNDGIIGSRNI